MDIVQKLAAGPRVTVRRPGAPDNDGTCVVYWMQRAQRGIDNPALDVAVEAANALRKPVVVFFAPVPFYPSGNLRHYTFQWQRAFPTSPVRLPGAALGSYCGGGRSTAWSDSARR